MKTVFITGSSTGIGYECAKIFMENGWNVVATMRNLQNAPDSLKQRNVLIVKMDVTDDDSIKNAIREYLIDGGKKGSSPRDVARKIYMIAESRKRKMQYVVGKSTEIVALSKILPDKMVRMIIKKTMMK